MVWLQIVFTEKQVHKKENVLTTIKREIQPICIECSWNLVWDCKMLTPFIITGFKIYVADEDDTCKNVEDPWKNAEYSWKNGKRYKSEHRKYVKECNYLGI